MRLWYYFLFSCLVWNFFENLYWKVEFFCLLLENWVVFFFFKDGGNWCDLLSVEWRFYLTLTILVKCQMGVILSLHKCAMNIPWCRTLFEVMGPPWFEPAHIWVGSALSRGWTWILLYHNCHHKQEPWFPAIGRNIDRLIGYF